MVPLGKPVKTNVVNPSGYTLNYNEYIVYNTQQIKMKYLIQVKFNFKWATDVRLLCDRETTMFVIGLLNSD